MSKKPTEATQNLRDKAQEYISSLKGEGRFTLPELIEYLEEEHPDITSSVNNLRVTVTNTLKHFDGSGIVNTGEKDTETKRKGPNPVIWRRMTTDDALKAELEKTEPASPEPEKITGDPDEASPEEKAPEEKAPEEPKHEDIDSVQAEHEDSFEKPKTSSVETDSSSEEFEF